MNKGFNMTAIEETAENKKEFPVLYEKIIQEIQEIIGDPETLQILKEKRDFGLAKYKELSFQSSFENAMASPTIKHACEELIDAMNYISHQIFKDGVLHQGENSEEFRDILDTLFIIYRSLSLKKDI
jgi:hypothetical protein